MSHLGGNSAEERKSPDSVRGIPYSASTTDIPISSLGTERIPRRTSGKW